MIIGLYIYEKETTKKLPRLKPGVTNIIGRRKVL